MAFFPPPAMVHYVAFEKIACANAHTTGCPQQRWWVFFFTSKLKCDTSISKRKMRLRPNYSIKWASSQGLETADVGRIKDLAGGMTAANIEFGFRMEISERMIDRTLRIVKESRKWEIKCPPRRERERERGAYLRTEIECAGAWTVE